MTRMNFAVLSIVAAATAASARGARAQQIAQRTIERNAVEAVIWGLPAVSYERMYQALRTANGGPNQVVYWSHLSDWKNQTLWAHSDAVNLLAFIDTKDVGPMVVEVPWADSGAITGTIADATLRTLDVIGPAGKDKGKFARYLVLPPNYKGGDVQGYYILRPKTFQVIIAGHSLVLGSTAADVARAGDYVRQLKFYPLNRVMRSPPMRFIDASDVVFDATIPYDVRFFRSLDGLVDREPWLTGDTAVAGRLATLGIAPGRPFAPDSAMEALLNRAAAVAHGAIEERYQAALSRAFWAAGVGGGGGGGALHWAAPDSAKSATVSVAFASPTGEGKGELALMAIQDSAGVPFDGSATYRLTVPRTVPVKGYWSVTVYDRATHTAFRDVPWSGRSSHTAGLVRNADSSLTFAFSSSQPAGAEANWLPTKAGSAFEVVFRFYGPERALLTKTWRLPDLAKMRSH